MRPVPLVGKTNPDLVVFITTEACATAARLVPSKFRTEISALCQKMKVSVWEQRYNFE